MLLVDRLRAGVGAQVQITLQDGGQLHLLVQRVGADWLSGRTGARSVILPVRAITSIEGLSARALPETSHTRRLLGMGSPLRALARSRETVIVTGVGGELGRGVIAHVGADHLDVAVKSEGAAPGAQPTHPNDRSGPRWFWFAAARPLCAAASQSSARRAGRRTDDRCTRRALPPPRATGRVHQSECPPGHRS